MDKTERLRLGLVVDQADTWSKRYAEALKKRSELRHSAATAVKDLRGALVPVEVGGVTHQVLPLGQPQARPLADLARFVAVKPLSPEDTELLHQLEAEVPAAIRDVQPLLAARGAKAGADATDAAEFLTDYVQWGLADGIDGTLDRVSPPAADPADAGPFDLAQALAPAAGLAAALRPHGTAELFPAAAVRDPLATFTAAERHPHLARAVTAGHEYVVVVSPPPATAATLLAALAAEG